MSLSIEQIVKESISRANRWHKDGLNDWSPLEWAGAMCGEAGECANAAKKVKRLVQGIASINHDTPEQQRHFESILDAQAAVAREVADTILYGVLVAASVGVDLEPVIKAVFNAKSEEYGFPERL